MNVKSAIYYGIIVIGLGNLIVLSFHRISQPTLIVIAIILCWFISKIDTKQHSPDTYYEVGFTYTIISIIASMIVLAFKGLGEHGFSVILGNFAIALLTSAFGLILRATSEKRPIYEDIKEYNNALLDLSTSLRIITDDLNKSTLSLVNKINNQSKKIDEVVDNFSVVIKSELDTLEKSIEDNSISNKNNQLEVNESIRNFGDILKINETTISKLNINTTELSGNISSFNSQNLLIKNELESFIENMNQGEIDLQEGLKSNFDEINITLNKINDQTQNNQLESLIVDSNQLVLDQFNSVLDSINKIKLSTDKVKPETISTLKINNDEEILDEIRIIKEIISTKKKKFWEYFTR